MPALPLPIPETKPATEFIDGRMVQKMSPYGLHGRVQLKIGAALQQWAEARGRGRVGTEWDFDLTPYGEQTNRLVPDVAFLSYERVSYDDEPSAQVPRIAPDVAVDILSEGQTLENSRRRLKILFATGAQLAILIDPRKERAWLIDPQSTRMLGPDDYIEHAALPEFRMPLRACFQRTPPSTALRSAQDDKLG